MIIIQIYKKVPNKIAFRNKALILNTELIKTISGKMGWKGEGTKEDPIVITGNNIPLKLKLSKNDSFIIFKNLNLTSLTLYRCRNITLTECKIHKLILNRCDNNVIQNNSIINLETLFSKANDIEENRISRVKNSNYEGLFFKVFSYFAVIFGFLLVLFSIRDLITLNIDWMSVYFFIVGLVVVVSVSSIIHINFQTKKLLPNEFHNNSSISHLKQIFYPGTSL